MEQKKLLTVKEVQAETRLSRSMIYKLLDTGVLRRVRLPGCAKVLVAADAVDEYIAQGVAAGNAKVEG